MYEDSVTIGKENFDFGHDSPRQDGPMDFDAPNQNLSPSSFKVSPITEENITIQPQLIIIAWSVLLFNWILPLLILLIQKICTKCSLKTKPVVSTFNEIESQEKKSSNCNLCIIIVFLVVSPFLLILTSWLLRCRKVTKIGARAMNQIDTPVLKPQDIQRRITAPEAEVRASIIQDFSMMPKTLTTRKVSEIHKGNMLENLQKGANKIHPQDPTGPNPLFHHKGIRNLSSFDTPNTIADSP
jgi:NADH:ubiquinone oxidoreductase subunit 3 (subunit A)